MNVSLLKEVFSRPGVAQSISDQHEWRDVKQCVRCGAVNDGEEIRAIADIKHSCAFPLLEELGVVNDQSRYVGDV